ncbi:MAG: MarR family transcriptional regulator, partial [Lachnospiraceae bacterium]|nr:MarR family transcriptional regulator [Lachnospiraceae bacterium]
TLAVTQRTWHFVPLAHHGDDDGKAHRTCHGTNEIICINLCKEAPTLNELSDVMGSSHQNVKQILLRLEKKGFIATVPDEKDKRKQRIVVTDAAREFLESNDNNGKHSKYVIGRIFDGIDEKSLINTIQTIMKMERNLSKI